jgi:hypothetical protein
VFIVCTRNTARSKSIPLMCTHVDSYKFSTVRPPSFEFFVTRPNLLEIEIFERRIGMRIKNDCFLWNTY